MHLEKMCNPTDPLDILQEPESDQDFDDRRNMDSEESDIAEKNTYTTLSLNEAPIAQLLHAALSDIDRCQSLDIFTRT